MKTSTWIWSSLAAGFLTALPVAAADSVAQPTVPEALQNRDDAMIAWDFYQKTPIGDDAAWELFLKENEIVSGSSAATAAKDFLNKVVKQTVADGIGVKSKYFWAHCLRLAGENTGNVSVIAVANAHVPTAPAAPAAPAASTQRSADEQKAYDKLVEDHAYYIEMADRYGTEITKEPQVPAEPARKKRRADAIAQLAKQQQADALAQAAKNAALIQGEDAKFKQKDAPQKPDLSAAKQKSAAELAGEARAQGEKLGIPPASLPLLAAKGASDSPFFAMIGTRMVTPYTIKMEGDDKGMISSSSTTVRPYLELGWASFWTMDPKRKARNPEDMTEVAVYPDGLSQPIFFTSRGLDVDGRVSVLLNQTDKIDATAVAGSGDINAELTVDKLAWIGAYGTTAWSVGPGGRISGSANRSERRVHGEYFAGMHLNFSSVSQSDSSKRMSLFRFGLGASWVDRLTYDPASGKSKILFDGAMPKYSTKVSPTFEAEMWYPVSSFGMVKLGTRLYGKLDPSPWTVSIAYTFDAEKVFKGLSGFQSDSTKTATTPAAAAAAEPAKQ